MGGADLSLGGAEAAGAYRRHVEKVPEAESDAYFKSRPLASRIGAHASPQSEPIGSREALMARRRSNARYGILPDGPPRPANWGGYLIVPERVEFWQGRRSRLHDRPRLHAPVWWLVYRAAGAVSSAGVRAMNCRPAAAPLHRAVDFVADSGMPLAKPTGVRCAAAGRGKPLPHLWRPGAAGGVQQFAAFARNVRQSSRRGGYAQVACDALSRRAGAGDDLAAR